MPETTTDFNKYNSTAVHRGVDTIRQYEEFKLLPVLVRLLAQGEPVSVERLALEGGWSEDEVRAGLARHPSVEWDDQGRIAGFGMTLRPTSHRFDFDGKTVYGWCASDALSFPVLLGRPGIVSSTCPVTGQTIRVEVTPKAVVRVDPPGAVVSLVRPAERVKDVRAEICGLGHFFSSREAASAWLAEYPDGLLHSVAEDFEVHRRVLAELGWKDNFTEGWQEALNAWAPAARVFSAVFKLTNVGETPAALEKLAATAGLSPDETASLVSQFFGNEARIQDGLVHLEMATTRQPSSRFELRIGDRRLYTGGCAPDQFWIAFFIDEPVDIRGTCPATGAPIRVVVSATGVEAVEPAEAVVGLVGPARVQAVEHPEEFDEQVCVHQPFFASMDAASAWKLQHPHGRLFPVREYFDFERQLLTPIAGDLMTTVGQPKKDNVIIQENKEGSHV